MKRKMKQKTIGYKFVKAIPKEIEKRTLYITIDYATAIHLCCCGCGREVVTPFSPTDWKLIYNGASVTLSPSIGNWSFECRSHYWIVENTVKWDRQWPLKKIQAKRAYNHAAKQAHYNHPGPVCPSPSQSHQGLLSKFFKWFSK